MKLPPIKKFSWSLFVLTLKEHILSQTHMGFEGFFFTGLALLEVKNNNWGALYWIF